MQVVERTFGVLKGRWAILQQPLRYPTRETAMEISTACAVLHNICIAQVNNI
jgi:hypothetical protein